VTFSVSDQRSGIFVPGAMPVIPWPRNPGHVASAGGGALDTAERPARKVNAKAVRIMGKAYTTGRGMPRSCDQARVFEYEVAFDSLRLEATVLEMRRSRRSRSFHRGATESRR
jgi:hypothetical protein